MALARSGAALLLAISWCSLLSQTETQSTLKIRVRDFSGAPIPTANISILSASGKAKKVHATELGEAVVRLDQGSYTISASALGFDSYQAPVQMAAGSPRSLEIELKVAEMSTGDCFDLCVEPEVMQFEHYAPLVEISSLPFESVTLLPKRLHFSLFRRWVL